MRKPEDINILIACEESGRICTEFLNRGFNVFSCDIIDTSGQHPERHIKQDVTPLLGKGPHHFKTCDGKEWDIDKFDLIVGHPPCTDLSVSGALRFEQKRKDGRQEASIKFFCKFLEAECEHVAIENPVNIMSGQYIVKWFPELAKKYGLPRKPDQIIHPYMFGHPESKKTCLWLKNLPKLEPTKVLPLPASGHWNNQTEDRQNKLIIDSKWIGYNDPRTKIYRSKTYPGIATAIAQQWGDYLLKQ